MHEFSIAEAVIEQVADEVRRAGSDGRVRQVSLAIGCLSGVHVDSLRFAFEALAPGTLVDGAEWFIRQPRAAGHCLDCGATFETDDFFAACTQCAGGNVRVEGGRDMLLESIELDDGD